MALFAVSHQLVSLDIDIGRRLVKGVTELSIKPKTRELSEIRLHCDRPVVRSASVNGLACEFERVGPTTRQQVLDKISRTQDTDEGELVIRFPSEFGVEESTSAGFKMAKVRIEFYLVDAKTGLVFSECDDEGHATTTVHTETCMYPSVTRSWLPCVDAMHERCTWDLFYTVPACVESAGKSLPMTVVSVGELSSLVVHPRDPLRKVFRYVMSTATPACTLGFAAGPFTSACTLDSSLLAAGRSDAAAPPPLDEGRAEKPQGSDSEKDDDGDGDGDGDEDDDDDDDDGAAAAPASTSVTVSPATVDAIGGIYAFAHGGQQAELENTCAFLPEALGFHSQEFGAYPYTSFKIVFVEGLRAPVVTCASLMLASAALLHPATVIEAAYEARRALGLGVAQQWFGTYVAAGGWADQWLVVGLAGFTAAAFVRHSLGHNEHRFRLRRDMARLCHADVNQRALSYAGPRGGDDAAFVRLKAPVVLHMLDRRMVKGGQSLGLARMAAKVLGACVSGDLGAAHAVTTAWFLRGCRRVSGVDVAAFGAQWIHGTGCPVFHMAYAFNRKKLAVEITVHQESTNAHATAPWAAPQVFRGPLTARIREADGTPYEHVLDIGERVRRFEVQFNTKYKRIRRSTKRFRQRQMAAADDAGAGAALFGAESAAAKRAWRVVEWGEADDESLASATFEWIRVDPDLEWACVVHFDQPAFMWAAQLQRDRDVAAQADAVAALQRLPSAAASTALMRAVMDARVFYRVRVAAALALAALATERLAWIGLHHLVSIYKARYCVPGAGAGGCEPLDAPRLPRPNDFSSAAEYFTQRAVLAALSNIRDRRGEAPAPARRLLLAALRYNDNSANAYADGHYLAGLAAAAANAVAASTRFATAAGCADAMAEVERLRALDLLVPSFHNVVTCAALEALVRVSLVQPRARVFNTALFAAMADAHAYAPVRQTAVSGLLLHWGPRVPPVARLMAAWAADCEHPRLAVAVARHAVQLLMVRAMVLGRQHHSLLFMEEQGPAADEHIDTPARLVGGFEALIDDGIADSPELRTILASAAYDSAVPAESRRLLAAVHALVYQTVDESMPPPPLQPRRRLKIRLQPKSVKPPEGSPLSSDSEDMPLGALLGVSQELAPQVPKPKRKYQRKAPRPSDELVVDDDDDDDVPLMLPPIAGTRPPPLAVPDASLNSPVYSAMPTATPPLPLPPPPPVSAPPIKLKLKLSKVASSAILDTITSPTTSSSPLAREILPGTPPPPPPSAPAIPSAPATPTVPAKPAEASAGVAGGTRKLLHRVLRKLSRHPDAFPFMRPVDVVLDGCPTYYDVIKQPMDLGTVKRKLETNGYATADEFEADVRLMLANCYAFNPLGTPVHVMGESVEKAFEAEWIKCGLSASTTVEPGPIESGPKTPPVPKATPKTVRISTGKRKSFQSPATHSAPPSVEAADEFVGLPDVKRIKTTPDLGLGALDSNDPDAIIEYLDQTAPKPTLDWPSMCTRVLLRLQAQPSAIEFMAPVDPIKQGVPTYFDVIKRPIDLSTIRTKLNRRSYASADEFREDLELLFSNCYLFNTPGTYVHTQCVTLHAIFEATWTRLSQAPDLPMDDRAYERARSVLGKLKRDEACWPFLKPVDPVALGVPTYFDLVKNPMDMSTIQKKLAKKSYALVAEFVADIQLIIDDCFLFNLKDTPVHDCGRALHSLANKLLESDHWNRWLFY